MKVSPADAAECAEELFPLVRSGQRVTMDVDPFQAFALASALQLAARHPLVDDDMRSLIERAARGFRDSLAALGATVAAGVLDRGFHESAADDPPAS